MDYDLRIPVTADQKRLIAQAAESDELDMAAWARPILIRAAERKLSRDGIARRKADQSGDH